MKFITDSEKFLKPAPRYAQMAVILREQGLEVQDDDYELIDLMIQECDRLLSLRVFSRRSAVSLRYQFLA